MMKPPATQLPPELLLDIFSHLQNAGEEQEADQASLKSATLVCRAFAEPAQAILWQSGATLEGAGDIAKFIKSASRRRVGPKEITVKDGRDAIDETLLIRLWEHIRGVERLTIISGETRVSAETFSYSALADLKSLGLCVRLKPSKSTTSLPFELNKLNLIDTEILTPHQASFLSTIARSSSTSMRTLSLSSISGSAHLAVSRSILPFAPNLRHLGLSNESAHDPIHYVRFLESTRSLRSLECTSLPLPLLHSLPVSLKGLATMEETRDLQVNQLKIAFERLKGLERLYFACSRKEFEELEGGTELVREMEKREVEWHFAEDY